MTKNDLFFPIAAPPNRVLMDKASPIMKPIRFEQQGACAISQRSGTLTLIAPSLLEKFVFVATVVCQPRAPAEKLRDSSSPTEALGARTAVSARHPRLQAGEPGAL